MTEHRWIANWADLVEFEVVPVANTDTPPDRLHIGGCGSMPFPESVSRLSRIAAAVGWLLALQVATAAPQPADRRLTGVVVDAQGGIIAAADVTVACGRTEWRAVSDSQGRYAIDGLPALACLVAAERGQLGSGHVPVDLASGPVSDVVLTLSVRPFASEVVVTPTRGEKVSATGVPESVGVLTRLDLDARPYGVLPQVLREEPGVLAQQTTAAQGSPIIRGLTGQNNVYLVDGVRFNTAAWRSGPSQYLAWLDPALVGRMEIVRGPGSVQYGSDAMGGTIQVLTAVPTLLPAGTRFGGHVGLSTAAADASRQVEASFLARTARVSFQLGASARSVGDLRPGRARDSHAAATRFLGLPSGVVGTRLRRTGFSQSGGHLVVQAAAGAGASVTGIYRHDAQAGVRRYDRELGGAGLFRSEFDPQALDFGVLRYQRGATGLADSVWASFSVNIQRDGTLEQARPTSRIDRQRARTTAYGYQAQGTALAASRHTVLFGGEGYDEYIAATRVLESGGGAHPARPEIPDGTRYTSLGLFLQDSIDVIPGRLHVRGGLRYGRFQFGTTADAALGVPAEAVTTDTLTGQVGAVIGITKALGVTASVSRGFRAANAFDLGAIGISGGGGFEISPARAAALRGLTGSDAGSTAVSTGKPIGPLEPEVVYAYEAGLRLNTGRISASIVGFDLELRDAIQRRTVIFATPIVGTVISGHEIVAQDAAGRAYVALDPRPIATRVNVDRSRAIGVEADGQVRLGTTWTLRGHFSLVNGHELGTGVHMRRMPPPMGGLSLRWSPASGRVWLEGVGSFARPQTRLNPGDVSDARIGATRTNSSVAAFFSGTAVDLGLVRDGLLVATGETLAQVQARVLGGATASPMFTRTNGHVVVGVRGGWRLAPRIHLTLVTENLADRNYRLHGSGVDGPGANVHARLRVAF